MKKLKLFAVIGLLSLLTTCNQAPERKLPNQDTAQSILKINIADDPETLDPRAARLLRDLTVVKQLFDGLMRLDENGKPSPAVAQSVEVSEDLLTYTFHLRESYWSNGESVTAHDFVYAWYKVLDPSFQTDYSHMLYPIKNAKLIREGSCPLAALGVLAVDDRTLVVQLEEPTPFFLELTAFPTYFPVNRTVDIRCPDWNSKEEYFVSNGPFVIKSWKSRDELQLKKNSFYWDKDAVKLEGIVLSMITDNNTEAELYEKNELDWLGQPISHNIAAELLADLKKKNKLLSYEIAGTCWFVFNTKKAPFDDIRVRKAFSYAINRQDIVNHILQGYQIPATSPIPYFMRTHEKPFFEDGNQKLAKEFLDSYLKEKGLTRADFPKITLMHSSAERNSKIAQVVQQQWERALEIPITLEMFEYKITRSMMRQGDFQVASGQWIADYNDPIAFLEIFKYSNDSSNGNGMNDSNWQNEKYISLLDQSKTEKDLQKRKVLLREAEEILVDEMPIAPLYHYTFDYVKKDYVNNVILSPLGIADYKKAEIYR